MSNDAMRDAFTAWYKKDGDLHDTLIGADGRFVFLSVQRDWEIWQAALDATAQNERPIDPADIAAVAAAVRAAGVQGEIVNSVAVAAIDSLIARGCHSPAQPIWRCFHCDESFSDSSKAAEHFGTSLMHEPACQIDIAKYREMEKYVESAREEDTEAYRSVHRLQSEHQTALRREEEKGYARGLADAQKYPSIQFRHEGSADWMDVDAREGVVQSGIEHRVLAAPAQSDVLAKLDDLCAELGCPAGINRFDFLRMKLSAQSEAKPVYQMQQVNGAWKDMSEDEYVSLGGKHARILYTAPAQSEAKVLCETCGGSKVDPGGQGYCRSCKQQSEAKPVYPVYQIHSVDDGWQNVDIAEYEEWVYKKRIVYTAPSAAPATAGGDALNTEGTCPDYARKQAQHAELESKYIAKCNECAELQSYLDMMTSGEPEPTAPDGDVGDVWHSIPWLPPEIDDDFYGTQYSVPVLLHDGEKVIERVARWSFVGDGWVGSDYAEGPDPSDYEWLNENAKKWMLLSDAALLAKRGEATTGTDAELPEEWLPINDAPWADDLIWLRKGDSIDGPRAIDNDDYDKYTHYAPCEPPSLRLSTLAKRGGAS